jgi:hypothetical protein
VRAALNGDGGRFRAVVEGQPCAAERVGEGIVEEQRANSLARCGYSDRDEIASSKRAVLPAALAGGVVQLAAVDQSPDAFTFQTEAEAASEAIVTVTVPLAAAKK